MYCLWGFVLLHVPANALDHETNLKRVNVTGSYLLVVVFIAACEKKSAQLRQLYYQDMFETAVTPKTQIFILKVHLNY